MTLSPHARALRQLPLALTTFRLVLVPVVLGLALWDAAGWIFAVVLTLAFWADVFDGVTARSLGVSTPALRRYDSLVDILHYVIVLAALWLLLPEVVLAIRWHLAGLVALELLAEFVCWLRFRQMAATHTWTCKIWGVALWLATVELLGLKRPTPLLELALWIGYVALGEVILIHLLARRPPIDVPSVWHLPDRGAL